MLFKFGRFICAVWIKLRFGLTVSGLENVPAKGGFVLAGNHVSYLDPVVLGVACPVDVFFMAKEELFKGMFGVLLKNVNAFPVHRNTADLGAIRMAMRVVAAGKGLVIFPEGARQPEGMLGAGLPGAGFIAQKLSVPVVPAFVRGTAQALPPNAKKIKYCRLHVAFGKPILFERRMPNQDAASLIMDRIKELSCSVLN